MLGATIALASVAGCGEKDEPDAGEIAQQAEASVVEETTPSELDIAGTWSGTLRQQGLRPFKVRARIRAGDRESLVSYTGIDCAGTWTPEGRYNDALIFTERIDRGKGGKCKGIGTVTLTPVGDRLLYEFEGGGVASRGRLHRVG